MPTDSELYALVHRGTPGDVDFYLRQARGGGRVLELGCGAGRILLPLAESGSWMTGLDMDEGALALIEEALEYAEPPVRERVELVQGDMCDFQLPDRFDLIIIGFNTLYCLEDRGQMLSCLRCARAHLAAGGRIIWDAYAIDDFHANESPVTDEDADELEDPVVSVQYEGLVYDVYENTRWDRNAQSLEVAYRYQPRDGSPPMLQTLSHCYLLTGQAVPLCTEAGLRVVSMHGDFHGGAFTGDSGHMVCVAVSEGGGLGRRVSFPALHVNPPPWPSPTFRGGGTYWDGAWAGCDAWRGQSFRAWM